MCRPLVCHFVVWHVVSSHNQIYLEFYVSSSFLIMSVVLFEWPVFEICFCFFNIYFKYFNLNNFFCKFILRSKSLRNIQAYQVSKKTHFLPNKIIQPKYLWFAKCSPYHHHQTLSFFLFFLHAFAFPGFQSLSSCTTPFSLVSTFFWRNPLTFLVQDSKASE